jgi:hypothetical protein
VKRILLTTLAITLAACSQQRTEAREPKLPVLPAKFDLNCSAPTRLGTQLPPGTTGGFRVSVDLSAKKFSVPWNKVQEPIKAADPREIVFLNEHIERGVDNNPMHIEMRFDVRNGTLIYHNMYSALFPVNESFSAHCKVMKRA